MTVFGWDASDFDWPRGPMDLRAAAADGISFFTHKATEGTSVKHVHTGEALNRARDAGLEFIGAYHVVRTGNVAAQVAYFLAYLDQVAPWWRTFPGFFLQVDLELWPYDQVSAATGLEFTRQLIAAQSKRVILYASRGQYGNSLAGSPAPLWNAAYGTNPAVHYPDAYRGDGSANWAPYSGLTPVFWQYGSRLRIGSQPTCDANAFRGSLADLRALIVGGVQPTEDDDMGMHFVAVNGDSSIYVAPGYAAPSGRMAAYGLTPAAWEAYKVIVPVANTVTMPDAAALARYYDTAPQPWPVGSTGGAAGPTHDELVEAAREGANLAEDS